MKYAYKVMSREIKVKFLELENKDLKEKLSKAKNTIEWLKSVIKNERAERDLAND